MFTYYLQLLSCLERIIHDFKILSSENRFLISLLSQKQTSGMYKFPVNHLRVALGNTASYRNLIYFLCKTKKSDFLANI